MKLSIVLAVAALSAETFACANIGQACKKGDPDVCQCGAPLTVSPNIHSPMYVFDCLHVGLSSCPAELILSLVREAVSVPVDGSRAIFSVP